MKTINEIISSRKINGIADYVALYKDIGQEIKNNSISGKKIKIAILPSFTINGIKETLCVKCLQAGITPEIYVSSYNQYSQEVLDKDSSLYKFNPDLAIIFIDVISILGEQYFLPYQIFDVHGKAWIKSKLKEISSLIEKIKENSSAKILLHNFEIPSYSPLGILENKQKLGFIESVEALNIGLRSAVKNDSGVFIFDYNSFCSNIGKRNIMDRKMYYLGDIKINLQYIPELCEEYVAYIKPLMSIARKCVVLDLDNTLWGGIIGEDGMEGIRLGPTPEGRPFWEFQKWLLSLFNRGVILAINSKNNFDDVSEVFKKHPYMVLKEKHFAAMQINWNDKISNMKAIAQELEIGMDSLVFIDDDKLSRDIIRRSLPEVLVVELPEDPSLYLTALMKINDFNTFQITEEDKRRGKMYAEQRKRKEFQTTATDISEYLKGMETVVTIEKANSFNIPRISQLTQKTNQFNMTARRYPEEDIKKFSKDENYIVVSVKVEDKFGDNGITGAAIVEKGADKWRIDNFLLSCRVIGRKVEEALLAYILNEAKKEKAKILTGEFIPTKKNAPATGFYKNNGFSLERRESSKEEWEYNIENNIEKGYAPPNFIKVIVKEAGA